MPNQSGCVFGLTFLSPIRDESDAVPSHDLQLRNHLAHLPKDERSLFAVAGGTHLARLVILDDIIYVGMPACEEHLRSKYLIFETNCDSNVDTYLAQLAQRNPREIDAIWGHCTGYPGAADPGLFVRYMKACQIDTTFFFAAVSEKSVPETLAALRTQHEVAEFIAQHQGADPARTQQDLLALLATLAAAPAPMPGAMRQPRAIKTGGRNE